MATEYSYDELLAFLSLAGDRGLMPTATAQALAVACRKVLGILTEPEREDLRKLNVDEVMQRFSNKRAKDFNPSSLATYGHRVRRAIDNFTAWRSNPAAFRVKTRNTTGRTRPRERGTTPLEGQPAVESTWDAYPARDPAPDNDSTFSTSTLVRAGRVVTISGLPRDITTAEAARLADFIRMIALE